MLGSVNTPGVGKAELDAVRQIAANAASAAAAAQRTADEAKEEAEHGGSGASGIELADVTGVAITSGNGKVTIKWTDPDDLVYNDATLARWVGTKLVRKIGSAPTSASDGTVVIDSTVKNAYATNGYEDTGLTNGTTYFYRLFPHTAAGTHTAGTSTSATPNLYDPNLAVSDSAVTVYSGLSSNTKTVTVSSSSSGNLSVESSNTLVATAAISGSTVTVTYVAPGTATVTVTQAASGDYTGGTATISVNAVYGVRYGYRVKKSEGNPSARVEYLFDAVGATPAHMDFTNGKFEYGSWVDKWFVTENKPLMLKNDGTVDYYLDPKDYTKKEDGVTASDVSNTAYAGNAMAQIPLCWVKRYEEDGYEYEIVSNVQYDADYKAYAHTRADGTIADFFYHSMFGASGSEAKLRSLSGQALAQSLTTEKQLAGATANGEKWYINSWSQRELIRTLLVLMGKSTDTQSVFGNGNCQGASSASALKATGTLKDKGQFFGYNSNNQQVKVFHIEGFWGDQWIRTAGLINNSGKIYVKMTPEGQGYRVTDVTGYTDTGVSAPAGSGAYISAMKCSEYGMIPTAASGSATTYYTDGYWANNSQLDYLLAGASADNASTIGGAFCFNVNNAPSNANWNNGCGLSYLKRTAFNSNALHNPQPLLKIARHRAGIVGGGCRTKPR